MDSLAGYGSEDEYENENSRNNSGSQYHHPGGRGGGTHNHHQSTEQPPRYDDGTNYDDVTMDMSEDSSANDSVDGEEEDREQEEVGRSGGSSTRSSDTNNTYSRDRRDSDGGYRGKERDRDDYVEKRRSPPPPAPVKRGLLGDRPGDPNTMLPVWNSHSGGPVSQAGNNSEERPNSNRPMPLMDVRPFGDQHHPTHLQGDHSNNRHDKESADKRERDHEKDRERKYRDNDRDKDRHNSDRERDRDRDRYNDKDRDRDRHASDRERDRHAPDRDKRHHRKRSRSRSRERDRGSKRRSHSRSRERDRDRRSHYKGDSRKSSDSPDRRSRRSHSGSPPGGEFRASYKVSKKLHAMEKMGLQIKTPDGSMATAQMLMQKTLDDQVEKVKNATGIELPKYYNPAIMNPLKYAEQIQKKKLLWGNKGKDTVASGPSAAATVEESAANKANPVNKWQGAKFAQDNDGKVASKFLRLMGVKDPNVVAAPQQPAGEIVKKQEEMFEAMQAQYDVARATTHTMRGVGLGFGSTHRHF